MADNNEEDNNSNVVPIRRGSEAAKANFRKRKNEFFDKLMGPEQVNYETGESNYDSAPHAHDDDLGPVDAHTALGKHIAGAIANSGLEGLHAELSRLGHFNTGSTEAKIISMGKFKENKNNKRAMEDQT